MSHIEDRWFRTVTGPDGKQVKEPKPRNGIGLRWRVRYEDPDRRERSESFAKKSDADRFRTQVDAELLRGTYRDPDAGRITLRKYAGDWLAMQNFDAVTREAVESRMRLHILPILGGYRLDELASRPTVVKNWLDSLQRGERRLAASTAAKVLTHLNTILIAALDDGRIASNPCASRGVKMPRARERKVEPWTDGQRDAVRAALPERLAAVIDAGTGLGLRQSEIFGLSVEEIDFLRRHIYIRQQVKLVAGRPHFAPPKGEKERDFPVAPHVAEALAAHLAAFGAVTVTLPWHEPANRRRHGTPHMAQLLFTNMAGRALQRHGFNNNVWRPAILAAGLSSDRVNGCHMMRHLFASTLISEGVDVRTVAEFLGHSDGGALVLKTYSHLMPEAQEKATRALEKAFAGRAKIPGNGPLTALGGRETP